MKLTNAIKNAKNVYVLTYIANESCQVPITKMTAWKITENVADMEINEENEFLLPTGELVAFMNGNDFHIGNS